MMKRLLVVLMLFFTLITNAFGMKDRVEVVYSEEVELVSVVAYLANVPGYVWDGEVLAEYKSDVDSSFAAFKEHPIIKFVSDSLYRDGFNWHFPVTVALRFNIEDGCIVYNDKLVGSFDNYYDRITQKRESRFLDMLKDFYDRTDFHSFFKAHDSLYNECVCAMRKVVDSIDFAWYDSFFGKRENSTFKIYPGLLIGPANYAVHQKYNDGKEVFNAVMGCCDKDEEGNIFYGMSYTLPIIIHEFNHSYCNPLNEEFWDAIKEKATEVYAADSDFYSSIAYGSPLLVMNETFVEAAVIRYLMSHNVDLNGYTIEDWITMDEKEKRFIMIRDVIKALGEREELIDSFPTMKDFMPRYIEAVNGFTMK